MFISVVLPVYNERENLFQLIEEIEGALHDRPHEIVAVDDGSTDDSLEVLRSMAGRHASLRILCLSSNVGQSAACAAGFDAARGDVVVTMDSDGQNDPGDIPRLLAALEEDSGLAAAVGFRTMRRDSRWKQIQSRIANAVRNWITKDSVRDTGCSLKAMRRSVVLDLPRFDGMHRFMPTLIRRGGHRVVELPVSHRPRRYGRSKYGMWNRVFRGFRDALGVRWLERRALVYTVRGEDT